MKKAAIAAMALLLSVLFWMEAAADTVTRGDSLWKIAQKHLGITWQEIARENKISGPKYIIYPGQELMIPELKTSLHKERLWKNVGGDPYRGALAWAIDNFGLPDEIKSRVRENIAQDKYQWFPLGHSQELSQITFGKNKIWDKVLTA